MRDSVLVLEVAATAVVQPKLTVGQAGDQYEHEADRVTEQVMDISTHPQPI